MTALGLKLNDIPNLTLAHSTASQRTIGEFALEQECRELMTALQTARTPNEAIDIVQGKLDPMIFALIKKPNKTEIETATQEQLKNQRLKIEAKIGTIACRFLPTIQPTYS